jgi:hypothetical protein
MEKIDSEILLTDEETSSAQHTTSLESSRDDRRTPDIVNEEEPILEHLRYRIHEVYEDIPSRLRAYPDVQERCP